MSEAGQRRQGRRWLLVVALAVAGGALAWIALGNLGDNLVYYWSPSELLAAGKRAEGATVRLGGQVRPGSLQWEPEARNLRFVVQDEAQAVDVVSDRPPPEMLREGTGVLVEGTWDPDGVFRAHRLLVKHSNEYRAPSQENTSAPASVEDHRQRAIETVEGL